MFTQLRRRSLLLPMVLALDLLAAALFPVGVSVHAVQTPVSSPNVTPTLTSLTLKAVAARDSLLYRQDSALSARCRPLTPAGREAAGCPPLKGDPINTYRWQVNVDPSGDPHDGVDPRTGDAAKCHPSTSRLKGLYAGPLWAARELDPTVQQSDLCNWPSIHFAGQSKVVTNGDQSSWSPTVALPYWDGAHGIQDGKYLVSVTAEGFEIGGGYFTLPSPTSQVLVEMNPLPLPTGTLRGHAFLDMSPTNTQWDAPAEPGLAGFRARLTDFDGPVVDDYFGNPLCTEYVTDAQGHTLLDAGGRPTIKRIGQGCFSDLNGYVRIPNLGPNRYALTLIPCDPVDPNDPVHTNIVTETSTAGATGAAISAGALVTSIPVTPALTGFIPGERQITVGNDTFVVAAGGASGGSTSIPVQGKTASSAIAAGTPINIVKVTGCRSNSTNDIPETGIPGAPGTVVDVASRAYWSQTFTLEGNHDHDVWLMPNDTGFDTEMVVGGELVPFVHIGFAPRVDFRPGMGQTPQCYDRTLDRCTPGPLPYPPAPVGGYKGEIKGQVYAALNYTTGTGGLPNTNRQGLIGQKLDRPIRGGWVAISDMQNADSTVWSGPTNEDGTFDITGLPPSTYLVTAWDWYNDYIGDMFNVTVDGGSTGAGGVVDLGIFPLQAWFARLRGKVCIDTNGNGRCDPGEPGLQKILVQVLNRTNNAYEQGSNAVRTNVDGSYEITEAYPLGEYLVEQVYNPRYKTIGITYQACNDPQEHTVATPAVDVSFLSLISQCGRIDWALQPYAQNSVDNGGIVATVLYDSIRLKQNARAAQSNDYQVGIPDFPMQLYTPKRDPNGNYMFNLDGSYMTVEPDGIHDASGGLLPNRDPIGAGQPVSQYISEHWGPPVGCTARGANGDVINTYPSGLLQDVSAPGGSCVQGVMMSMNIGFGLDDYNLPSSATQPWPYGNPTPATLAGHGVQTVDGNFTLTAPLDPVSKQSVPGDYIARMNIPTDQVKACTAADNAELRAAGMDGCTVGKYDKPLYKVTTEQTNDIAYPTMFAPQGARYATPGSSVWPPQAGPAQQQPVGNPQASGDNPHTSSVGPDPICAGRVFNVKVTDPFFLAAGGSIYEGQQRHLCDAKLLHIQANQSVAPNFHVYTDVPIPTLFHGLILDDASTSVDPKTTNYGDVAGVPNAPMGIYDWTGRLITKVDSDYNGAYEVLLPSGNFGCPTVTGLCAEVYRHVGNDPGYVDSNGVPHPNANYQPAYRTITASFQALPGVYSPADVAPTKSTFSLVTNSGQIGVGNPAVCAPAVGQPVFYAVDKPYGPPGASIKVSGLNFAAGTSVKFTPVDSATGTLNGTVSGLAADGRSMTVTAPATPGAYQMNIVSSNQTTVNAITFHVIGNGYNPKIYEVGPAYPFKKVQDALDKAAAEFKAAGNPKPKQLVVVYPNTPSAFAPLGAYYENIIIYSRVKVQGVGPGGVYPDNTGVSGSILDGQFLGRAAFAPNDPNGATEPPLLAWYQKVQSIQSNYGWSGNQQVNDGEVVYVVARSNQDNAGWAPALDGFQIKGGNQFDFRGDLNNLNQRIVINTVVTQGGAVFLNSFADHFHLTNNLVNSNQGSYGAIRIGTPQVDPVKVNHNFDVQIGHNTITYNGGTNLAGAIAVFGGSDNYRIHDNFICGNQSAEYGGGISHFGLSPNGRIDHNQIVLNGSLDEGGGIQIAGELPKVGKLSPGAGSVTIDANVISANLAYDDGGGLRFLMAGNFPMLVTNNQITDNVSLHEGGGVALDDTPDVTFVHNTVAKNVTTATASTSTGQPAPAGLSSVYNSALLQASLPAGASKFSNPKMQNNIFFDNRAGSWNPTTGVQGIGLPGDASPIYLWDFGLADAPPPGAGSTTSGGLTSPNSLIGGTVDPFTASFNLQVAVAPQRLNVRFRPTAIVASSIPLDANGAYNPVGNYDLSAGSPARGVGAVPPATVANLVNHDIHDQARPSAGGWDAGAEEYYSTPAAPRVVA